MPTKPKTNKAATLEIIREGAEAWNRWIDQHLEYTINLNGIELSNASVAQATLSYANLRFAKLREADVKETNLEGANLSHTLLRAAHFLNTNLRNADMSYADLKSVTFERSNLENSVFNETILDDTRSYGLDLGMLSLHGKPSFKVEGPCQLGLDTLMLTRGRISSSFLKDCGLSDWEIELSKLYSDDLDSQTITEVLYKIHDIRVYQSIQISPLFISYSRLDEGFVDRLEPILTKKGIRFW